MLVFKEVHSVVRCADLKQQYALSMRFLASQKRKAKRFVDGRFQAKMPEESHGYCVAAVLSG
jgi:hypothetical protein